MDRKTVANTITVVQKKMNVVQEKVQYFLTHSVDRFVEGPAPAMAPALPETTVAVPALESLCIMSANGTRVLQITDCSQ